MVAKILLLFLFFVKMYLEIDSNINRLCEKVVDYYDIRTRFKDNSNHYSSGFKMGKIYDKIYYVY